MAGVRIRAGLVGDDEVLEGPCGPKRIVHADRTTTTVPARRHRQPGEETLASQLDDAFQISSIPTLMAVRDRTVLYARPGALPSQALEEVITKIRAADMDDVRRKAAAGTTGAN